MQHRLKLTAYKIIRRHSTDDYNLYDYIYMYYKFN
jgi:hypothetical protein